MPHNSNDSASASASHPPVPVDLPPKARIEVAVDLYGEDDVVAGALSLIDGNNEGERFLLFVGGEHAQGILDGAPVLYWPELWGLRTLLYVWNDTAIERVVNALRNPSWRVREMAARVIEARNIPAAPELIEAIADGTPRVRIAAVKALGTVGTREHTEDIQKLTRDPMIEVKRGARQALDTMRARYPRS